MTTESMTAGQQKEPEQHETTQRNADERMTGLMTKTRRESRKTRRAKATQQLRWDDVN